GADGERCAGVLAALEISDAVKVRDQPASCCRERRAQRADPGQGRRVALRRAARAPAAQRHANAEPCEPHSSCCAALVEAAHLLVFLPPASAQAPPLASERQARAGSLSQPWTKRSASAAAGWGETQGD